MPTTFQITQDDQPLAGLLFSCGQTAASFVKASPAANPPYRILKIVEIDVEAELQKFADGTYVDVPWAEYSHYSNNLRHIHLCRETGEPGMIAYVDPKTRALTPIRAGRWLTQFMGTRFSTGQIEEFAQAVGAPLPEILFATSGDEIERVYTHGPESCMSHATRKFDSHIHPTRAYAGFDLAVAYTTLLDRPDIISARALCWPAKKEFIRIYGRTRTEQYALERAFRRDGWKKTNLEGARFSKILTPGGYGYVVPYLDANSAVALETCLQFHRDGWLSGSTEGTQGTRSGKLSTFIECGHCHEPKALEDSPTPHDQDEPWCPDCRQEFAWTCNGSGIFYTNDEPHEEVKTYGSTYKYHLSYTHNRLDVFCMVASTWYIRSSSEYAEAT